jgi:hypothetical protein
MKHRTMTAQAAENCRYKLAVAAALSNILVLE